jgi:hypothetical protein
VIHAANIHRRNGGSSGLQLCHCCFIPSAETDDGRDKLRGNDERADEFSCAQPGRRGRAVSLLLRLTALLLLAWVVFLLALKGHVIAPQELSVQVSALADGLAIAYVALAYVFWHGARDPSANRGAVYAAIILLTLKLANDLYELLVLLPAREAAISLADLVIALALLVSILEALPRMIKAGES